MTARAVLVVLLVVASGCQFVTGGGERAATPTRTATPAPVPTVTAGTVEGGDLPPGVSGRGVTDVTALVRAHVDAVVGTSYVWRERWRTRFGSDAVSTRVSGWRLRLVNGTYYHVETVRGRSPGSTGLRTGTERFADGEHHYYRRTRAGNRTDRYTVFPARNASVSLTSRAVDSIRAFLDLPDASVSTVRVDGERRYEITAHRDVYGPVDAYNYTARAVVDPDGFVRRLAVSYATVPTPRWIDEARARLRGGDAPAHSPDGQVTPIAVYVSNAATSPAEAVPTTTTPGVAPPTANTPGDTATPAWNRTGTGIDAAAVPGSR